MDLNAFQKAVEDDQTQITPPGREDCFTVAVGTHGRDNLSKAKLQHVSITSNKKSTGKWLPIFIKIS